MQPLIDIQLPAHIITRNHVSLLAILHRLLRINGAQRRIVLLLKQRFGSIGDHHVGLVIHQLLENAGVLRQLQAGLRQMTVHKRFVGAASRLDYPHLRLVDLLNRLVLRFIRAAHQRNFAIDAQRLCEPGDLLTFKRHGDTAQRDITLLRYKIIAQGFPRGRHPLYFCAEAGGQRLRHADVQPFILAVAAQKGVGLVIAGGADLQGFALTNVIKVGLRLSRAGHQK